MRRPAQGHGLGFCIYSALDISHLTLGTVSLALRSVSPQGATRALPTHYAKSLLGALCAPVIGTPIHRMLIFRGF